MGDGTNYSNNSPDFSCGSYSLCKGYMPLVLRWNLLVSLRFRHADFIRLRNRSLMYSSGRVFIIVGASFVLFLASRLTTVSLDMIASGYIFSYPFAFYNSKSQPRKYLRIILGIIGE